MLLPAARVAKSCSRRLDKKCRQPAAAAAAAARSLFLVLVAGPIPIAMAPSIWVPLLLPLDRPAPCFSVCLRTLLAKLC